MEKYYKILKEINENKLNITKLYILSCIDTKDENLASEKLEYIYDTWLDIDGDICLAKLCDIVCEHWEEILNEEYDYDDIISDLFV